MTVESSTENLPSDSSTVTTKPGAFDPSWQLAITVEYYFRYAVLAIGVVGTAANALVMYALISHHNARETKKRAINLLIINQNLIDLVSCVLLLIGVCIQITSTRIYLTGAIGYFLCVMFIHDTGAYCALYGSTINLVFVTIERYLKVVHPFWSKRSLKRWMIFAAMAFAWAGGIASAAIPVAFLHLDFEDGFCTMTTSSDEQGWIYGSCNFAILFLCPLTIFVYCYGRMVVVMRRQMHALAGHGVEGPAQPSSASQAQSKRVKWNIVKTMIIVSIAFVVSWFPHTIYFVMVALWVQSGYLMVGYFPTVFLIYLNTCLNPFIYAAKHEGVRHQLARMMVCRKRNAVEDAPQNRTAAGT